MISRYEDEIICDLAEIYGILDYRALSPVQAATLAVGLHMKSRTKKAITGTKVDDDITMLAAILDETRQIAWMFSKDGSRGRNRPKSVVKELARERDNNIKSFENLEDFKRAWNGN